MPSVTVLEGYGCTETGGIVSGTPPLEPRHGTVGKAVPNVEVRIVGVDGNDLPPGQDGEIVVRQLMNVTVSVDHRVSDGATAAQFLQELKALLQSPLKLLL